MEGEEREKFMRRVDNLFLVSRIFLDQRIQALGAENEELRSKLLWNDDLGPRQLNLWLAEVNKFEEPAVCGCYSCFISKRFDAEMNIEGVATMSAIVSSTRGSRCILKDHLIAHALNIGLDVKVWDVPVDFDETPDFNHPDYNKDTFVLQLSERGKILDCHIQICQSSDTRHWWVVYGSRLSPILFHKNMDLDKLKELFSILSDERGIFFVDPKSRKNYLDTQSK